MKVLIADDDPTSRILLEETVQEWGYDVVGAEDGQQGWELMQGNDTPMLAILDWMMPGMDGPELCTKLRESKNSHCFYIIMLTSKKEKKDVVLGIDSGADAFLTKPVDLEELKCRLAAGKRILTHQNQMAQIAQAGIAVSDRKTQVNPAQQRAPISRVHADLAKRYANDVDDFSDDSLLNAAPRKMMGERKVPVLGNFIVLEKLGEGGMGAVYRAYNTKLQTEVALKVMSTAMFRLQTNAAARFYREAQIASMVRSEHLVQVRDMQQENGLFYLVMELIDGRNAMQCLRAAIDRGEVGLLEERALDMCIAVAKGLAVAHAGGIVHRDVKPDNILLPFVGSGPQLDFEAAKLADLGIARCDINPDGLTLDNIALGTVGFMAPEQIRDAKHAGKPADVFGLGSTLYTLLSGRAPFGGNSTYEIFNETINSPHVPLETLRPSVSPTTRAIIDRCLQKDPTQRYADAGCLLEDLIYCRKLMETSRATASTRSNHALPRVVEPAVMPIGF